MWPHLTLLTLLPFYAFCLKLVFLQNQELVVTAFDPLIDCWVRGYTEGVFIQIYILERKTCKYHKCQRMCNQLLESTTNGFFLFATCCDLSPQSHKIKLVIAFHLKGQTPNAKPTLPGFNFMDLHWNCSSSAKSNSWKREIAPLVSV